MLKWIDVCWIDGKEPKMCNLYKFQGLGVTADYCLDYPLDFDGGSVYVPKEIPFTTIVDFFNHPTIHRLSEYLELKEQQK